MMLKVFIQREYLNEIQVFPFFQEPTAHHPGYVWWLGAVKNAEHLLSNL